MKKILTILLVLISALSLSSCMSSPINIDKIYKEPEEEIINYADALKSSCAISRSDVTFSGTVIDYDSKEGSYYIISYSKLGRLSFLKNNVNVYPDSSEKYYEGKIVGLDAKNSLSLVKVNAPAGTFSVVNAKNDLILAENVFTVSTPLSLDSSTNFSRINTVTGGIVSKINSCDFLTCAPMNSSSYGGGVYDSEGQFLGILVNKIYSDIEGDQYIEGMTTAIQAEYVYKSYIDMKSDGEVKRSSLGITVTQWHEGLDSVLDVKVQVPDYDYTYVAITDVDSNGNSYGKLKKTDLIDYINDVKIYCNDDISVFIRYAKIGDTLKFKIKRYNGSTFDVLDVDVVLIK